MSRGGPIVVKVGGAATGEAGPLDDIASLAKKGERVVLVHGGGPLTSEWSRKLGGEPRFEGGLRVTDEATRDVALAVMAGLVNKRLVAELRSRGAAAVGISGADGGLLILVRADPALGLVGHVKSVRPDALLALLGAGFVPVVAPAGIDPEGELVNVNADEIAGALAVALTARLLVLVTDVPGVRDRDGAVLPSLDAIGVARLRGEGAVSGGMLPKLDACVLAASAGSVAAIVAASERRGVIRLDGGEHVGTIVTLRQPVG